VHPSTAALLPYFEYDHLPPTLQEVSKPFHDLAHAVAAQSEGPETTMGLRKLLEAKDCIVRAHLTERDAGLAQARQTQPEA
jgi:hypothetical protein